MAIKITGISFERCTIDYAQGAYHIEAAIYKHPSEDSWRGGLGSKLLMLLKDK